uniref:LysM domain receptor-like kinase 4 n=1 Tax=Tanacetum cinerariifolium TaxID=118510 RepID=A0A6L2P8N8_TANCI|nr:LysM domain receptor-like kinase 4 [Tanacetum cinerariifolium]
MAEYVSVYNATRHAMLLRNLIAGLKIINSISRPLKIYCDNSAAMSFSNSIASFDQQLKVHKLEELEEATDGFSLQNRLSASVYRGSLKGKTVVIKEMGANAPKGYLHNFASPAYVHKDINSSNILLSKALRAKISKFGLVRLFDKDQNGNSSLKCPFESKGRKAVYVNNDDGKEVMLSEEVLSVWGDEKHATDKVSYLIDPRLQATHPLGFVIDQDELALRMI